MGTDAFGTIESGINAVAPGGTLNVAAGTYIEQVAIDQSVNLIGAGQSSTTIQAPAGLSGDEIEITGGASVSLSGITVNPVSSLTGIDVNGASLAANAIAVTGFATGISVENAGAVSITDSTISGATTAILVGSWAGDTANLTATNDSFAGNTVGVQNNQTSGLLTAALDWWGNPSGPTNASNPGGGGAQAVGNVDFNPWLGDASIVTPDNLMVLASAGNQYAVSPGSGNTSLGLSVNGSPMGTVTGGGTITFVGTGGMVTINGETGSGSTDVFTITNTSVKFNAADGLSGSTINLADTGLAFGVNAQGTTNTFSITGTGGTGPSAKLVGDSGTNAFVFSAAGKLLGSIQGAGSSSLNDAAYSTGVNVNLGNGTNGSATGVSGTVAGITAVIGSSHNDTLNAGTVPGVALTGGLGTNTLSGTGAGDSVLESISSSYTLTNTKLTGASPAFTDNLSGITVATLTGSSATSNAFTVSGWTGTGSLSSPAGSTATATDSASGSFTLTAAQLTAPNTTLGLSGITTANLTDSSTSGGNTFAIRGWTGGGTIKGTAETLVDSVTASTALAKTSLAVTGLPTLTLSGFTVANLTDTAGGNTFTVSGWSGSGSLTDSASGADTVAASKSAAFALSNGLVTAGTMSLTLSGITTANLTDTGGGHAFTVSGWTGTGSLTDTAATGDTITDVASGSFTLANSQLIAPNATLGLGNITSANLTDSSSSGGNSFNIAGWTGKASLSGTDDTLVNTVAASVALTNASLAVAGLPTITLSGISTANLTDTTGGNTFTVSGWMGGGSLIDSGTGDTVTASKTAGYILSNNLLSSTDGMMLRLSGVTTANLTDSTSGGGNTFTVIGWTGAGTLKGTAETLVDSVSSSVVLAKTSLAVTGEPTLTLGGFTTANLTDMAGGNTFTVSGWTGSGSLADNASATDTVTASKSAGYTLTNTSLSFNRRHVGWLERNHDRQPRRH